MEKGYLAGSLFSEAEVSQRLKEGSILRKETPNIEWFNPIEAPCNDKSKLPTAADIFIGDTNEVINSDYVIADLSNSDPGVMMELGIAWGLQYAYEVVREIFTDLDADDLNFLSENGIKKRKIQAVLSDIRIPSSHNYEGVYIPMSFNQFVIGGIENMDGDIVSSFDKAVENIKK